MTSLKIDLQQSHIDFKIFPTKIYVHTKQAKLVNALCHKYEGTRPNSHDMYSNICDQTFWIFYFLCGFGFLHTQNKDLKVKSNAQTTKTMHIKSCMMHKCMTMKHLMHKGSYKDRKN